MPRLLTLRETAGLLKLRSPRVLHDAFYYGTLTDEHCFYIGGRRTIPESALGKIARALSRSGRIQVTAPDAA
jgi:hypothetical protein